MLTLATSRTPGRFVVRDCFNCIEAGNPPAFCQRCDGCIDDEDRPNWTPKNAADLEYLSWFPAHVVGVRGGAPSVPPSEKT